MSFQRTTLIKPTGGKRHKKIFVKNNQICFLILECGDKNVVNKMDVPKAHDMATINDCKIKYKIVPEVLKINSFINSVIKTIVRTDIGVKPKACDIWVNVSGEVLPGQNITVSGTSAKRQAINDTIKFLYNLCKVILFKVLSFLNTLNHLYEYKFSKSRLL